MSIKNHRQASFIRILLGFLIAISIGFSVYAIAPDKKPDKPKSDR